MQQITTINTIEISSICDFKCPYCPAQAQKKHRDTGFMTWEVFEATIDWCKHFCVKGTQKEINLFGVGEPTLHKDLIKFIEYARKKLPFRQILHINTNGNTMTERLARELKRAGLNHIGITGHKPHPIAKTIRICQDVGLEFHLSFDPILQPNNWAGQVDWFEPRYSYPCHWLDTGQIMVMSNGDVTTCCIDAFARGKFGTIFDDLTELRTRPHEVCRNCHHIVPERMRLIKVA